MTVTASPATIFDLADLAGAMTRLHWQIAREMWHGGETFAYRAPGGELLALLGFYPTFGPDDVEGWFCPGPAASAHMTGLALALRLTIRQSPYRRIVTICRTREGARIARFCGFRQEGAIEAGEVWAYGAAAVDFRGRQPGAAEGTAVEPAA